MNIVVFCPNLIGDTIMATPAFRAIRTGFPHATIIGVIKPHVAPVLDGLSFFDRLIGYDPKARDRSARTFAALRALRRERPDLAVLFPNSFRSALLAWLAGARRRVGFGRSGRAILLTQRLTEPRGKNGRRVPNPIVEHYLELSRRLGCRIDSMRTELATTAADEADADVAWDELGLSRDEPVICLNTGGAFGPAKNWPVEHFATLARRFAAEDGFAVLVICGPSERAYAQAIVREANHPRVVSLADRPLGLGLSKACVRRSALLITTDSGPRHFAAPFRVRVLTLFGPTFIAWTRTHDPLAAHLYQPVPCGPCQQPVCPLGHHRCMRDLSPDAVYRAAVRMLAHSTRRAGA